MTRRRAATSLPSWVFNVLGVVVLVISLVSHSAVHVARRQLLLSGGGAWFTDAIAFGLAFGNWTAAARLPAPSRQRHASPTSSSPKTRTLNSHGKGGRHASGITSTCR
jgi:hypothetical protein